MLYAYKEVKESEQADRVDFGGSMLTEQRYDRILQMLKEYKSVTVNQVKEELGISESTVRRDITALHKAHRLVKVFGGAIECESQIISSEPSVEQKKELNQKEKALIGKFAAELIQEEEFIFVDAGTTTGYMVEHIRPGKITVVTNAVAHAQTLAARGVKVILLGGELKSSTEAIVGNVTMKTLEMYHFTKGFFGTNGVTMEYGCTTPDENEALIKRTAVRQCKEAYILADVSKFNHISSVTFADFREVFVVTDQISEGYMNKNNVILATE